MVEHFFPNPEDADKMAAIRATFAKLWGLEKEDAETETVIQVRNLAMDLSGMGFGSFCS